MYILHAPNDCDFPDDDNDVDDDDDDGAHVAMMRVNESRARSKSW